nr:hypothetical protein [Tanacetum cinerariifolium]
MVDGECFQVEVDCCGGERWKTSTLDDESLGQESDSEVEKNIVVEQPMFMGGRTKSNAPPTKTHRKTVYRGNPLPKKHPCCSTCLIFGYSLVDCPKAAPKRVVNNIEKGNKTFNPDSVKPKTCYNPVAKQSIGGTSNSPKTTSKTYVSTSCNGIFILSKPLDALNVGYPGTDEVEYGNKASKSDDDGKPLENVDYSGDHDSEDEVEPVDNEMASFMASKPS